MVICLQRGADCLHMVQLMSLHPKLHHLLPRFNPDWCYLIGTSLCRFLWKRGHINGCSAVIVVVCNSRIFEVHASFTQ